MLPKERREKLVPIVKKFLEDGKNEDELKKLMPDIDKKQHQQLSKLLGEAGKLVNDKKKETKEIPFDS